MGSTIVQVDARQCAASSAAFGQRHGTVFSTSHRPPKHELEPLLNERGEGGLALGRFCAGALEECFVQSNGGSHAAEHTDGMSVCQYSLWGAAVRALRRPV